MAEVSGLMEIGRLGGFLQHQDVQDVEEERALAEDDQRFTAPWSTATAQVCPKEQGQQREHQAELESRKRETRRILAHVYPLNKRVIASHEPKVAEAIPSTK